jgi:PAS domain S-box-containing protein
MMAKRKKRKEAAPELPDDTLRLALVSGRTAAWDWDIKSGREHRFGDLKTIFGIDADVYDAHIDDLRSTIHPDDIDAATKAMLHARDNRERYSAEFRIVWPDGTVKWVRATGKFYYSADGEPERMLGMATDVTERKRAEDAIRESDARYRRIVETTTEGITVADANFCITFVNRQMAEMLGYEPGEMLGRSVLDFVFPEDVEQKRHIFKRRRAGVRERYDDRLRHKSGREVLVRIGTAPVFNDIGEFVGALATVSDITEGKRAEQALQQREKELLEAQRLAHVGSWVWDPETDRITWSEESYRIAGRDTNLPPVNFREQRQLYTSESWERLQRAVEEALRSGTPYELDLELSRQDGTKKWIRTRGEAQRDTRGRIALLRGTTQDITDQKNAEEVLKSVNQRVIEAQEQEATRIARDLHDDINQQLSILMLGIQIIKKKPLVSQDEFRERMDELSNQAERISSGVRSLAHRLHSSELEYLGIVAAMRGHCRESAKQHNVEIHFSHNEVSPTIPYDISLCLFRVLQEALHNAMKHSGVGRFEVHLYETPGGIGLRVSDSGVGFDQEAINQHGLGLLSMRERLRLVQGSLSISAKPDCGTTINAFVPITGEGKFNAAAG